MKNPPTIKSARTLDGLRVEVEWSTRETLTVDLTGLVRGPFRALRDRAVFEKMQASNWGDGIDWPGDLSLGSDTLYDLCREQAGLPTVAEFNDWMKRNGLSLASASEALGMTRRMIAHYRTGSRPIPKVVGLAMVGMERNGNALKPQGGASGSARGRSPHLTNRTPGGPVTTCLVEQTDWIAKLAFVNK